MSRHLITLCSPEDRKKAKHYATVAPEGTRVEFKATKRSIPQNDRLWLLLTEVARQLVWHGQKRPPEDWKDYFMHALQGERWMPNEDGGMIPIGHSTSDLSKDEFGDLMALIEAFCARHHVQLPWTPND